MSMTIDQKVVEMRFDNKDFERNTQQSMSTLAKLKASLNLKGATKGLEDIGSAAKNVNMSGLGASVEAVRMRFSALEVMAVTALANITNSAINAGKSLISSFTIEPIMSGFQEYETQINAVQTILANTSSKGTTLNQVNQALDELNHYADMTIYNFTEMTRNIGTFTAAGVDLDTSVQAIKGIANLAAVSGSTSQQASTAMYQLSQALAAGTVKLQDWNSVVNAGMGGQVFQDALKETARVHGIAIDQMIKDEGSFRETLQKGWLSSQILTETLAKFTGDLSEEQLRSIGYTEEQITAIIKMGQTANDAATKVKTFTQLMDTLKEAAQSGWTQTWELLIGDFEEAKAFYTELSDTFSAMIGASAASRNNLLEGALTSNWDKLIGKINEAGVSSDAFESKLKTTMTEAGFDVEALVKKYGSLNKVFESGAVSTDILKTAVNGLKSSTLDLSSISETLKLGSVGDDVKKVQQALSDLGYDLGEFGVDGKIGSKTLAAIKAFQEANKLTVDGLIGPETRSALEKASGTNVQLAESYDDLADSVTKLSGRELIIDSLRNAITGIVRIAGVAKQSWIDIFPKMTSEQLYNLIDGFHDFSKNLIINSENAIYLRHTLRGLFAILDIITTLTGGGLKVGLKLLGKLFGFAGDDVLKFTATIGDSIYNFRNWLFEENRVVKALENLGEGFISGAKTVYSWIKTFYQLPIVQSKIQWLKDSIGKSMDNISGYFDGGMERINAFIERVKAMDSITMDDLPAIFKDFKENVLDYFFNLDDKFDDLNKMFVTFKETVTTKMEEAGESIDSLKTKIIDFAKSVKETLSDHTGELLLIGFGVSLIAAVLLIRKALDKAGTIKNEIAELISSLGGMIDAKKMQIKAEALKTFATSIAILAGSVFVLAQLDYGKLWSAVGAITVLAAGIAVLAIGLGKFEKLGTIGKANLSFLAIAASLLILVNTMKQMEGLDTTKLHGSLVLLAVLAAGLVGVAVALNKWAPKMSAGVLYMVGFAMSLKILISAFRDLDDLKTNHIGRSIAIMLSAMAGLALVLKAAQKASFGGPVKMGVSAMGILAAVLALKMLVGIIDDIASLDVSSISKNTKAFITIFGMFAVLMASSKLAGKYALRAGVGIVGMSAALLIIIEAFKRMAEIDPMDLNKSMDVIQKMLLIFAVLTGMSKFAGANSAKVGVMMLAMSGSILILTGVIYLLSQMDPDGVNRGVKAIIALEAAYGALIFLSKYAASSKDATKSLIAMTVTIGVLAASIGALALINPTNLIAASASLSMVIGVFSLLVASTKFAGKASASIAIMVAAVAGLALIIGILASTNPKNAIEVSGALSILIVSLSAAMVVTSKAGMFAKGALVSLGVMTLVVAALGGLLYLLRNLNPQNALGVSASLSMLLLSLSGSLAILTVVGTLPTAAMSQGIVGLIGVIAVVGILMAGLGALVTLVPKAKQFLEAGLPVLKSIGLGLGEFIGGIVGGALDGLSSGLPAVGDNISSFINNACVDSSALTGIKNLAQAFLMISAADFLDAITFWDGKSSLKSFGENLADFGTALKTFGDKVNGINTSAIEAAVPAAKSLAELNDMIPNEGGLLGALFGNNNWNTFSTGLVQFGVSLKRYGTAVNGVDSGAITTSVTAAKGLAQLNDMIPNEGGLLGVLFGNNNWNTFGSGLVQFGISLKRYGIAVSGVDSGSITNSVEAASGLADLNGKIPNSGGLLSVLFGDNTWSTFSEGLNAFGMALTKYSWTVSSVNTSAINKSVEAAGGLVELNDAISGEANFWNMFTGTDMEAFSRSIVAFGTAMSEYSKSVQNVNKSKMETTAEAAKVLAKISDSVSGGTSQLYDFANNLYQLGLGISKFDSETKNVSPTRISLLSSALRGLASSAKSFGSDAGSGLNSFSSALERLGNKSIDAFISSFNNAGSKVKTAATTMMSNFVSGLSSKTSSVLSTIAVMVNGTLTALNYKKMSFYSAGANLISGFNSGMSSNNTAASTAGTMASRAVSAIRSYYNSFYNAGYYCVSGFVSGINANSFRAAAAASAMASSAYQAAKRALKINSPSKIFYGLGSGTIEGFVNAIYDGTSTVYRSSADMANSAKDGFGKAISSVTDYLNDKMNTSPTIRPVMDLSNVQKGTRLISSMLSSGQGIRLGFAGVDAVSSDMSYRQNGTDNSELLSVMKGLRKDLANVPRNTYNVNGVTYDDGSNVSTAVRALIRAAEIERRV